MRQEKLICSFVFELSGFSPKAVVMTRWLPFWIKEHDCSHWKKVSQKREVTLHCQKRWSKVSVSSWQKVQRSLSLIAILYRKEFVGRRLWRSLNWKIIILVLFLHVLASWNVFLQSISSSLRSQSLYHFVYEALGFSLFVATRFLYVKLLGYFVFWKTLVNDSTSAVSTPSIFSLNLILIVFNVAIIPLKASGQLLQWYLLKDSV